MHLKRAALQLGLQLIQDKLGQAAGVPSFNALVPEDKKESIERLPTSPRQIKDRSAKVQPPRVVTTR